MLSTPSSRNAETFSRRNCSSSFSKTAPVADSRSGMPMRRSRGTSGSGLTIARSYCSKRFSCAISIESRIPALVSKAVLAPRRSIRALVARVVPWTNTSTSLGESPASSKTCVTPSRTATAGASAVVSSFLVVNRSPVSKATSVNVPPMSTARRTVPICAA